MRLVNLLQTTGIFSIFRRPPPTGSPASVVNSPFPPTVPPALSAPTAALRMVERYPHLLPHSASRGDVEAWLAETRLRDLAKGCRVPELVLDEDELAELYTCICETAGWALPLPVVEVVTAEPEALPEPPRIELVVSNPLPEVEGPSRYRMAAVRFLDWVQVTGRDGTYPAERVNALYLEHVSGLGMAALSIDHVKAELRQLSGVVTEVEDKDKTVRGRQRGNRKSRRARVVMWTLPASVSASDDIPFDLPRRGEVVRLAA